MTSSQRPHRLVATAALTYAVLALGCGGGGRDEGKAKATSEAAKPTGCATDKDCKGSRVCVKSQCVDPATKPAPQAAPPPRPAAPPAPAQPAPAARRSAVPSEQDWRVVGEITITGSSRMNCETKKIREWMRIRCQGKNEAGGTPRGVTVIQTSAPDATFPSSAGGVASLVFPYAEGTAVDAIFRWTGNQRHQFRSRWPSGTAEPAIKGEFLGVPPPSDPNRVWPCASDADCNSPYKCAFQGNCMKL